MRFTNLLTKGLLGGCLIGALGTVMPETLFFSELEAQTIISGGATPLPHVWPTVGCLGAYSLAKPAWLVAIGLAKLVAITITVLAGYRGGFIFPFMFAGLALGTGFAAFLSAYVCSKRAPPHARLAWRAQSTPPSRAQCWRPPSCSRALRGAPTASPPSSSPRSSRCK